MQSAFATHATQPLPAAQTGVAPVQARDDEDVPSTLQVTAVVPAQVIAPGVQTWLGTHAPARQVPPVQALPSGELLIAHSPFCAEQELTRHWPGGAQATGAPPWQAPLRQTSPVVQPLLSEQAAALFVRTQPCCAVQVSFVQGLLSLQLSAAQLKTQLPPPWQTCPAGQLATALSWPLLQVWNCVPLAQRPPLQLLQRPAIQPKLSVQFVVCSCPLAQACV